MNTMEIKEESFNATLNRVKQFLCLNSFNVSSSDIKDAVKELCVARLCNIVGITGKYNYKSDFFNFFSSIVGEAICRKLNVRVQIASDELRLIKYEHINLIDEVERYLNNSIEEAFLDSFNLVDNFKYLIPKLKKV